MKKQIVFIGIAISMLVYSCGSDPKKDSSNEKTAKTKSEKKEMSTEVYAKIVNEQRALLMEKYWPKLQENSEKENENLYEEYNEEMKDILEKYGFDREYDLPRYFRRNMKEVMKYQKTNPDFIDYPDFGKAKTKIIDIGMSKAKD
ncbi:MAG: hypothetical protein R6U85_06025 [Salinivirgaceae bacterium]